MKKAKFTDEQIAFVLKQVELGTPVEEVCRKVGVSDQTFYRWKSKFGGMLPSDIKRLKQLEEENRKLKQLVADLSLDKIMLQDVLSKKFLKPAIKKDMVKYLGQTYAVSERRSCRVLKLNRSLYRRRPKRDEQAFLRMRIKEIAATRVRYGYRRIHVLLCREGWKVNHKRVYRLYRAEGLNLRNKSKRKKVSAPRVPEKNMAAAINECWAMDFVSDQFYNGKRFRALTLIDTYSRECIAIHVDKAIKGDTVVAVLDGVKESRGLPKKIKVDNGPEFISRALDAWAYFNKVQLEYSRPGKPTDNPHIESFNGSLRDECLNVHWFMSLEDAKQKIEKWRMDYNEFRPHSGLTYKTPAEFAASARIEAS
ncbi:MAG: IS3 family transposase [Peptococcaceae bacterium]|nr:IS3 family transposase [Peptococcaceae bacterium]